MEEEIVEEIIEEQVNATAERAKRAYPFPFSAGYATTSEYVSFPMRTVGK